MGHLWLLLLFACASPAAVPGAIDERVVAQAASDTEREQGHSR